MKKHEKALEKIKYRESPDTLPPARILILDFGAQYTQLIARSIRELGVYCEIYPWHVAFEKIQAFNPNGLILSGGPASVYASSTGRDSDKASNGAPEEGLPDASSIHSAGTPPAAPPEIYSMGKPILGICYGMQTLVAQLGGTVENAARHEYGHAVVHTCVDSSLLGKSKTKLPVWMSHGDRVTALPVGFHAIATSSNSPYAAIADETRQYFGVQFHPEVTHTDAGKKILSCFVHDICHCGNDWIAEKIIDRTIQVIRQRVDHEAVLLGLSGGVDSAVVAALLQRAIGAQLTCIFVDTGLLRLYEGDMVMQTFAEHLGVKVIRVQAESRFLRRLTGITDPEQKRTAIGNLFVEIFEQEATQITNAKWLAQGTIYPDVIESAGGTHSTAKVIKSHHNVGGLPARMKLKLLEPLRELFKDEVRKIGTELGLPKQLINRHPFPGPGLAVRILGEVTKEFADMLRYADAIYLEELEKHDLYDKISQAFAVFLPIKSVGVVGDNRAYEYVLALRAVQSVDFMTANWARIPYDVLETISNRISNEVRGISRVVYDISNKPPATIEWE